MALTSVAFAGTSDGTTTVNMISAPAAGTEIVVKNINIFNSDTADATVTLKIGTRVITKVTLNTGDTLIYEDVLVLNSATGNLTLVLAAVATSDELDFHGSYLLDA